MTDTYFLRADHECQRGDWAAHKIVCASSSRRPNYTITVKIQADELSVLNGTDGANERITVQRVIECPAAASFKQLHQALQIAFGYGDFRLHAFHVIDPAHFDDPDTQSYSRIRQNVHHLLHITEKGQKNNYFHEHDFVQADDPSTGCPQAGRTMPPVKHTSNTYLYSIFENAAFKPLSLVYIYDFKNPIYHVITLLNENAPIVLSSGPNTAYFRVLSGIGPAMTGFEAIPRALPSGGRLPGNSRDSLRRFQNTLKTSPIAELTPDFDENSALGVNHLLRQTGLTEWKLTRGEGRDWMMEEMRAQGM